MRSVKEWIGKTDDSKPPRSCKLRIIDRQNNRCAITGIEFKDGDRIEFDHIKALWKGGENRESNLQAVLKLAHDVKTNKEATERSTSNRKKAKALGIRKPPTMKSRGFDRKERRPKTPLPPRAIYEGKKN